MFAFLRTQLKGIFFLEEAHASCNCLQRRHKSVAASGQVGNWNTNPDWSNRPGITRRLFSTNSDSVRKKKAPISSIHLVAGKPKPISHAARRVRMNSALGIGFGEARLTGPCNSV